MKTTNPFRISMVFGIIVVLSSLITRQTIAQSYFNPKNVQVEVRCSIDSSDVIEFERQKNWIIDWFSNRVIKDQKYQRKYISTRSDILKRIQQTNLVKIEIGSVDGIAVWRLDTIFYTDVVFNHRKYLSVLTHELAHDAFPVIYEPKINQLNYMEDWMIVLINKALKKSEKQDTFEGFADAMEYRRRPEEVYARICAMRFACGFKPDQIILLNTLDVISLRISTGELEDRNTRDLFSVINNRKYLCLLLNNLP